MVPMEWGECFVRPVKKAGRSLHADQKSHCVLALLSFACLAHSRNDSRTSYRLEFSSVAYILHVRFAKHSRQGRAFGTHIGKVSVSVTVFAYYLESEILTVSCKHIVADVCVGYVSVSSESRLPFSPEARFECPAVFGCATVDRLTFD